MKVKLESILKSPEDSVNIEARLMTRKHSGIGPLAQHLGKEDKIHVKKRR